MIQTNLEPEEKVEDKIKYMICSKTPTPAGSWGATGFTYNLSVNENLKPGLLDTGIQFSLQSSVSGCGLGTFGAFTGLSQRLNGDQKLRETFVTFLKREATLNGWHCLIATLGDTYINKILKGEVNLHEKFLESLGFKKVHEYINLVHSSTYCQRIYACDTKNLK